MKIKNDSVHDKCLNEERKKAQCLLAKWRNKNGCPFHAKSTGADGELGNAFSYVPVVIKAHDRGSSWKKQFIWVYNCCTGISAYCEDNAVGWQFCEEDTGIST